ncbi:MAG: arsenate reductase ArsC [Flavobacteriaceae bacterium]
MIICTGNSCRSQIAQGFMESLGAGKLEVFSAGIETHGVNPRAIKTMKEVGIDLSKNTSNLISDYEKITFDFILTRENLTTLSMAKSNPRNDRSFCH